MTHYPLTIEDGVKITDQESWTKRDAGVVVEVPAMVKELIEEIAVQARASEYVDQSSGVSARMTIALLENVVSNAERRGLRTNESIVRPRLADLQGAIAAISGKVELVYEGEQEGPTSVARHLIGKAVKALFARRFPDAYKTRGKDASTNAVYKPIVEWFASGRTVEVSDESTCAEFYDALRAVNGLEALAQKHLEATGPAELGPAMEFVLEGLHQHSILSRERLEGGGVSYRDMLKSMFSGFGGKDDD